MRDMPAAMPDHLEAGTGNYPGIAGLLAGCQYVLDRTIADIHANEMALKQRLRDGLEGIPGVRILSPPAPDGVGIVTMSADGVAASTLAECLDTEHRVMTRSGLHCAPEVHRILGTLETGAVRFSVGWASTEEDVDTAIQGVDAALRSRTVPVA